MGHDQSIIQSKFRIDDAKRKSKYPDKVYLTPSKLQKRNGEFLGQTPKVKKNMLILEKKVCRILLNTKIQCVCQDM